MKLSRENKSKLRNIFLYTLFSFNGLSILLGSVYIFTNPTDASWNIFGVILLITLLGNVVVTLMSFGHLGLDYAYLLLTIVFMIIIPIMNRSASIDVTNMTSRSNISVFLIFSLLVLATIIIVVKLLDPTSRDFSDKARHTKLNHTKTVLKIGTLFVLSALLILGIYLAYQLLIGRSSDAIELFFPQYSLFFSIIFLSIAALILKMYSKKNTSFVKVVVILIVMALSIILSVPLLMTPFMINDAEDSYREAFGEDPRELIPSEERMHFSNTAFSLPDYFFGKLSEEYRVQEDVLYYQGKTGVDQGINLHFDAYLPPESDDELPGNQSILMRIHGGGWTAGNKGSMNNAQVNKYFANQGYVVFDVQYGLSNEEKLFEFAEVPANIVAGFTIDDMVRHLGLFTDYLVEHNDDYHANLDSVFISGGSAGGQLANAVGLGLASGNYEELNSRLNVKGIIPVYPANGLPQAVNIEGSPELTDPSMLVKEDSPPALIYQGTHDGLVDQSVALAFDQTYDERGNSNSTLILMPFAGHSSNSYFPGYYNQVFIYYMERFMYQFK